ncbi:MAG: ABC transporter ATPase [Flavobacteriaceae bacterium]|nr:ABC transporter ATPase [Flavobacteriaceae bacterium]|tara:strand:+ start:146282 stop:146767 length:486 start_codon:yes stop_codon:yes gene_type:complete
MLVDFQSLSDESKIWIYPSSRKFYKEEIGEIEAQVKDFVTTWKSKDENFKASFEIKYNRFIVLAAEDSKAPLSGAEIDESVAFIISLQSKYDVILLDRLNVCFKQGEFVQYKDLKEFKKLIKNKSVSKKSIIFDNLISNLADYREFWEIPITDSWYNRFLK